MSVIVDSSIGVEWLDSAARAAGTRLTVLVEIDSGEHRTGVEPESDRLLTVARLVTDAKGLDLAGVLTHGGHAYDVADIDSISGIAEDERSGVVFAAERLRAAGLPCSEVSSGSTPTAVHATNLAGVTEMRPGVYLFGDCAQVQLGSCGVADIALSVLATVIATRPEKGTLVLDAGGLALSKDRSTARSSGRPETSIGDVDYGSVCDIDGRPFDGLEGGLLVVSEVHQEHGVVRAASAAALAALPIGSKVRILPNHACMTAAAHDSYAVVEGNAQEVVAIWQRCRGWRADAALV